MKRTIVQIAQVLVILVLILMIPLFVQSQSLQKSFKKQPEVSEQAAVSVQVLGASTSRSNENKIIGVEQETINKIALYTVLPLFIISVASFAKYKVTKKIV
jgi:uncharacterized protein YneF (UPF0154 family)